MVEKVPASRFTLPGITEDYFKRMFIGMPDFHLLIILTWFASPSVSSLSLSLCVCVCAAMHFANKSIMDEKMNDSNTHHKMSNDVSGHEVHCRTEDERSES